MAASTRRDNQLSSWRSPLHTLVARRYLTRSVLGAGGQGQVWEAWDQELERPVALKLFAEATSSSAFRAELAALATLRLPGVVELIGHGSTEDGAPFLAMQLVSGLPFPGAEGVVSWPWLAPRLARVLAVLGAVHTYGFVHGDIKPGNVLVDAGGLVTLLDFGLSRARQAADLRGAPLYGSGVYTAPELLEGGAATPRSDLYAVAVLAWVALEGRAPWGDGGGDPWALLHAIRERGAGLPSAPGVPPAARALIASLLAQAPADRPASASEALDALLRIQSGSDLDLPVLPTPSRERFTLDELRDLFFGPSRLLHLPDDAAAVLLAQTDGEPGAVQAELQRWCLTGLAAPSEGRLRVERTALRRLQRGEQRRLGVPTTGRPTSLARVDADVLAWTALAWPYTDAAWLARLTGLPIERVVASLARHQEHGRITLDREARAQDRTGGAGLARWDPLERAGAHARLAELLPTGEVGRLRHLLAADQLADACTEAAALAERAGRAGDLATGLALLEDAIRWALAEGDRPTALRLLESAVPLAVASEEREPLLILRALRRDDAFRGETGAAAPHFALVEAALSSLDGDATRAAAALTLVPLDLPEPLELRRQAVATRVARLGSLHEHDALLTQVEAQWAVVSPERRARTRGWWGQLRYRQGRFAEAAALHLAAANAKAGLDARLSSLLNAASALLESGQLTEASDVARRAEAQANVLRLVQYEARATWILRAAAYRSGALAPDTELIEAALALAEPRTSALLLLTEAGAAWRTASYELAQRTADAARNRFEAVHFEDGAALAASLAFAASGGGAPPAELSARVARCRLPLIQLQAMGLVGTACPVEWRSLARERAATEAKSRWSHRREVTSVREALTSLELEDLTPDAAGAISR